MRFSVVISENGGEKEETCEPLGVAGKSSSAESVQLQGSNNSNSKSVDYFFIYETPKRCKANQSCVPDSLSTIIRYFLD